MQSVTIDRLLFDASYRLHVGRGAAGVFDRARLGI
jgi:hypothetical protein